MSNYYRNGTDISSYASNWITNSAAYAAYSNNSITLNTSYGASFTAQIDEKLTNTTGYTYDGVDIATYCVASFVESSTTNLTYQTIPSWCNKLRVILIGGGAGGGTAQASYYWGGANWGQQTATVDQHFCNYYNSDQSSGQYRYQNSRYDLYQAGNFNQQAPNQNTAAGGGGGGGGSFIYLPTFDISSTKSTISIQVGAGGAGGAASNVVNSNLNGGSNKGQAGGSTVLNISSAAYASAGGGGISVNAWEAGAAGTVSGQNTGINNNGQAGTGYQDGGGGPPGVSGVSSTYSTNATITSYGRGGAGSGSRQGTGYPAGANGAPGYYRVYFLTN